MAVAFAAAVPGRVAAQQSPAAPSIGLPLPSIGLPLPVIGLQPPLDVRGAEPPSAPNGRRHIRPGQPIVFFGVPYNWGVAESQQAATPGEMLTPSLAPAVAVSTTGRLRLEIEPDYAQVFVDGEFVGTPADLRWVIELPAGTRRIEVRAPGHDALTFDARIVAGDVITYRDTLRAATLSAPTPVAAPRASTIYFIPGCYLGNVPPDQVKLPAGCDLSRLVTHRP